MKGAPAGLAAVDSAAEDRVLHRQVLAQIVRGERVLVLRDDVALRRSLEESGCTVHVHPSWPERLRDDVHDFDPQAIVAIDAFGEGGDSASRLRALVDAAPGARLVVVFWNASGAQRLLSLISGRPAPNPAVLDDEFRRWIGQAGLDVMRREPIESPAPPTAFPSELHSKLVSFLQQLNPACSSDRVLYVVARTPAGRVARAPGYVDGLLSVVIRNHRLGRLPLLDQAIFSLACQRYAALEIVVVTQSNEGGAVEAIDALLRTYQPLGKYSFRVVAEPSSRDIRSRLLNLGLDAARGRYVAFLDDDDVVYPHHYERLLEALRSGPEAWAFARARRAFLTRGRADELYCLAKRDVFDFDSYEMGALTVDNYMTSHSYVLDRARIGPLRLRFREEFNQLEDYAFVLELAAVYRPRFVGGAASCEYRIRDDGSNTVAESAQPGDIESVKRVWDSARAATDSVKRNLQTLMSLEELGLEIRKAMSRAAPPPVPPPVAVQAPAELRYRIADGINAAIKRAAPIHAVLRGVVSTVIGASKKRR